MQDSKEKSVVFVNVDYDVKTLKHQEFSVLKKVDFAIADGEFVCIVGPSGCGKTSILNIIAGFIQPTAGKVKLNIDGCKIPQPAVCFQSDTTFGWMSCKENFRFALKHNRRQILEHDTASLNEIAELTGLTAFLDFYPKELSGGMRKRLELGRAWLTGSPILLLDEPLGQLDHLTRQAMQITLQQLWWQDRRTVLMVTHDNEEALLLADRVLIMDGPPGRIAGSVKVPFDRPRADDCRYSLEFQELRHNLQRQLGNIANART